MREEDGQLTRSSRMAKTWKNLSASVIHVKRFKHREVPVDNFSFPMSLWSSASGVSGAFNASFPSTGSPESGSTHDSFISRMILKLWEGACCLVE